MLCSTTCESKLYHSIQNLYKVTFATNFQVQDYNRGFGIIRHNIPTVAANNSFGILRNLKMIGKGFVLFEINSSPSAFYIINPTCIVIGFKVNKCLRKLSKTAQPEGLFMLPSDDVI